MRAFLLLAFSSFLALPAQAQLGFGLRGGADFEPDAFFVGGHVVLRGVANAIDIEPSVEIGFGSSDVFGIMAMAQHAPPLQAFGMQGGGGGGAMQDISFTVLRANLNAMYPFDITDAGTASFYPIAGLGVYSFKYEDNSFIMAERHTEVGINLGAGVSFGMFGVDATVGIGDIADVALRAKVTFGG